MIAVENVTKTFGPVTAVEDVSFEVEPGEVVGFLGPNGAGKTTTMRMLTGTLQPDRGEVRFDGRPIGDALKAAKRRVGYLPERTPLYEDMLVSEFLDYAADLRELEGAPRRRGIEGAMGETGIDDVYRRPIAELSKGYRQRVALAAAILHEPDVLVLDEPTEGLDPNQRVGIRELVNRLGRERTVLLSTHVLAEVEATCGRLLIIRGGELVADGSVDELLERGTGGARYVVEVEGDGVVEGLRSLEGVASARSEPVDGRQRVEITAAGSEELRPEIFRLASRSGWTLWELRRRRESLERLFRQLTREGDPEADGTEDGTGG